MIYLLSCGFKFGKPMANFFFDVSYLKNPWREKHLRHGKKEEIDKFMESQKEFKKIVSSISQLIITYARLFPKEKMIFAICCSAGEYRSPMVVKKISNILNKNKIIHTIIDF